MPARWTTADIPDQTGRTVLITGANADIGYHTALQQEAPAGWLSRSGLGGCWAARASAAPLGVQAYRRLAFGHTGAGLSSTASGGGTNSTPVAAARASTWLRTTAPAATASTLAAATEPTTIPVNGSAPRGGRSRPVAATSAPAGDPSSGQADNQPDRRRHDRLGGQHESRAGWTAWVGPAAAAPRRRLSPPSSPRSAPGLTTTRPRPRARSLRWIYDDHHRTADRAAEEAFDQLNPDYEVPADQRSPTDAKPSGTARPPSPSGCGWPSTTHGSTTGTRSSGSPASSTSRRRHPRRPHPAHPHPKGFVGAPELDPSPVSLGVAGRDHPEGRPRCHPLGCVTSGPLGLP